MKESEHRLDSLNKIYFIGLCVLLSRFVFWIACCIYYNRYVGIGEFITQLNRWDSGWYSLIIKEGYSPLPMPSGEASWAFFPLYPLIIKIVHIITHIDIAIIGPVVSTIFFMLALNVAYKYIKNIGNEKAAIMYVLYMTFGVYSFYFSSLYTESLFLFLITSTLYYTDKQEYIKAGICGGLASATRNLGVLLVIAIVVKYICVFIKSNNKSLKGFVLGIITNSKLILSICLIPSGCFIYMFYLFKLTGDPLAFIRVQRAWGRNSGSIFQVILNAFKSLEIFNMFTVLMIIVGFCLCMYLFKHNRYVEGVMGIILLFIPISTGSLQSINRYMIGEYIYMMSGMLLLSHKNKFIAGCILGACIVIEFIFTLMWYAGNVNMC